MRRNPTQSLSRAARAEGVKPATVWKYFSSALTRNNGKIRVTQGDRFKVTLYVPGTDGNAIAIQTRSSKQRNEISEYLRDLGRYLRGDRDALAKWHGKKIAGVELVTAGSAIRAIEPALSDFSLYRVLNGSAA